MRCGSPACCSGRWENVARPSCAQVISDMSGAAWAPLIRDPARNTLRASALVNPVRTASGRARTAA